MEGTQTLPVPTGRLEFNVTIDRTDDVGAISNFLNRGFRDETQSLPHSANVTFPRQGTMRRIFLIARLRAAAAFFFLRMLGLS